MEMGSGGKNNIWVVDVLLENNEKDTLKLYDAYSIFGEYIALNRIYFDNLIDLLKKNKKTFTVAKGIEKVTGKDGADWTKNPWLLILAKDNEKNAPFWILIKRENDLTGYVTAVGPELFYGYLSNTKEKLEEMRKFLEYLVVYSQKWTVLILIPNFLS